MSTHDDEVRSRLQALHDAATRRTAGLAGGFEAIVEASSDIAVDDEHDPEGHTIAWERQLVGALLDDARTSLDEITEALQRLDEGTYGRCTMCGQDISPERLDAMPAAPACISCAVRSHQ
ncbi:MAG TPA: TraR/DksA C4-type zinc finger protein [Acidimicrobiales bacterium]|nr:TraR/DksA C4-type zinc finger protein [Acidimicrobiales bacterium]